jgi:hypothetical protein
MTERALSKPQIISELTKSPHGALEKYLPIGTRAVQDDADFFGHLVAWNHVKGQVRDARIALPVLALAGSTLAVLRENALAHLADLDPRSFVKALDFARLVKAPSRIMRRLVERYLRDLEANYGEWERTALQHRASIKTLYARYHVKPMTQADTALFKGAATSGRFAIVKQLASMTPEEIGGAIVAYKIPFLIARGALGKKATDPDVVLALIQRMSPTELVTNTKALERLGVKTVPALRAAYEAALERAGSAKRGKATLKTTKAAEALADDPKLSSKLRVLQEKQLDRLGGIDGRWLVLGDKSGSMEQAIEISRMVAAILTRMITGEVHLLFFDTSPRHIDVTGKTYEAIQAATAGIVANGGTSIGCGLQYLLDRKIDVDGIAIVSDGAENSAPLFGATYAKYAKAMDHEPTVYWYQTADGVPSRAAHPHLNDWQWQEGLRQWYAGLEAERAGFRRSCEAVNLDVQRFDLTHGTDYYALPNLVQTMRVGRYQLLDEVLATPFRRLDEVLDRTRGMEVIRHARTTQAV